MDAKHCKTIEQHNKFYRQIILSLFSHRSRGQQCMTNSYVFFFFCDLNPEAILAKQDLNSVLENGDSLYNFIDKSWPYLLASELPNYIQFRKKNMYHLLSGRQTLEAWHNLIL